MEIFKALCGITGESNVLKDENMSRHTTFKAGGPAKYFVMPSNTDEIIGITEYAKQYGIPYYVIGNGSNLLVSDAGFDGIIISIGRNMSEIQRNGCLITAQSGALLSAIGAYAAKNSLGGFEFASGIPGSLGGACVMNAGAYGGEMKDVLVSAKAVAQDGSIINIPVDKMELGYRRSIFLEKQYIVTEAVIRLYQTEEELIRNKMSELAAKRIEKQPLEYPSAGSTFKRPEGYFAGELIEKSGLKGKGIGGACISEKHAGFVINKSGATAGDVYNTIYFAIDEVMEKQGILLEPEVRFLGKF